MDKNQFTYIPAVSSPIPLSSHGEDFFGGSSGVFSAHNEDVTYPVQIESEASIFNSQKTSHQRGRVMEPNPEQVEMNEINPERVHVVAQPQVVLQPAADMRADALIPVLREIRAELRAESKKLDDLDEKMINSNDKLSAFNEALYTQLSSALTKHKLKGMGFMSYKDSPAVVAVLAFFMHDILRMHPVVVDLIVAGVEGLVLRNTIQNSQKILEKFSTANFEKVIRMLCRYITMSHQFAIIRLYDEKNAVRAGKFLGTALLKSDPSELLDVVLQAPTPRGTNIAKLSRLVKRSVKNLSLPANMKMKFKKGVRVQSLGNNSKMHKVSLVDYFTRAPMMTQNREYYTGDETLNFLGPHLVLRADVDRAQYNPAILPAAFQGMRLIQSNTETRTVIERLNSELETLIVRYESFAQQEVAREVTDVEMNKIRDIAQTLLEKCGSYLENRTGNYCKNKFHQNDIRLRREIIAKVGRLGRKVLSAYKICMRDRNCVEPRASFVESTNQLFCQPSLWKNMIPEGKVSNKCRSIFQDARNKLEETVTVSHYSILLSKF